MHEWNLSMRSWASEGQKTSSHLPYDRRIKATRVLTCITKWLTTSLKWVRTLSTCARWVHAIDKEKTSAQEANVIRSAKCEYTQWTKKRSALKKRMTFCHSKSARQKAQKNKEVSLRNASLSLYLERCQRGVRGVRAALSSSSPRQAPLIKFKPLLFCFGCSIACLPYSIVSLPLRDVQRVNAPTRRCSAAHCLIERAWFNSTCILFCFGCNVSTHRSSAALTRSH